MSLINSQESVSAIRITEIKKHQSDFSELELIEEFIEEQLDSYKRTLNGMEEGHYNNQLIN